MGRFFCPQVKYSVLYPVILKQHNVALTWTRGFKKQKLTMHVNVSHKTAILVKSGQFYGEKVLRFSLGCPLTALPQLCDPESNM